LGWNVEDYNLRRAFKWSYLPAMGSCGNGVNALILAQRNRTNRLHASRESVFVMLLY
jgi:hypothetical protein